MSDDEIQQNKRPDGSAAARRGERQAAALRENLKRRKDPSRGRAVAGHKTATASALSQPDTKPDPAR